MSLQVTEVQKALRCADHPMDGDTPAGLASSNGADSGRVDALRGLREVEGPGGMPKELRGDPGGTA